MPVKYDNNGTEYMYQLAKGRILSSEGQSGVHNIFDAVLPPPEG